MGHKILGERIISRSQPMWHKLGEVFSDSEIISPSEAAMRVAGDLDIKALPVYTNLGTVSHGVSEIPGQVVITRMPTHDDPSPEYLGFAKRGWIPESYVDLAKPLDHIDQSVYKLETAGVLEGGKRFFLSLRGEDWDVLGDGMRTYFLVQLSMEPGVGHRIRHTPVRVVCWNTEQMAVSQSNITLSIGHNQDAKRSLALCSSLLVRFRQCQEETKTLFEELAKAPATNEQVERILDAAYPNPPMPSKLRLVRTVMGSDEGSQKFQQTLDAGAMAMLTDAQEQWDKGVSRATRLREAGLKQYRSFEPSRLGGTLWAAYNAVTELSDWRQGKGSEVSATFGPRSQEKERAFTETVAILRG